LLKRAPFARAAHVRRCDRVEGRGRRNRIELQLQQLAGVERIERVGMKFGGVAPVPAPYRKYDARRLSRLIAAGLLGRIPPHAVAKRGQPFRERRHPVAVKPRVGDENVWHASLRRGGDVSEAGGGERAKRQALDWASDTRTS
jgi:hypothetical protein